MALRPISTFPTAATMPITTRSPSAIRVLDAAETCFFQHGFTLANISMISRESGVSRVTIHKHFNDKAGVFRAYCHFKFAADQALLQQYRQGPLPAWSAIEEILDSWAQPLFEEINNKAVLNDLIHALHLHCEDIYQQHRHALRLCIADLLARGLKQGELQLGAVGMTAQELATLIELAFNGLINSSQDNLDRTLITRMLQIYRAATAARA